MDGDATLAMLIREHERATGGDQVMVGQRWRYPGSPAVWTVGALVSLGGETAALLTGPRGDVLHVPTSVLASQYERMPDAR